MPGEFADAQLEKFVTHSQGLGGPLDVASMREGIAQRARARPRGPEMHEVRDLRIAELDARLYRPTPETGSLVVYLHGGGWTVGSLDSHDRACRRLAAGSGTTFFRSTIAWLSSTPGQHPSRTRSAS